MSYLPRERYLASLSYYSDNRSNDLAHSMLGVELHDKLRDQLSGKDYRYLIEGISALFFRARDIGVEEGQRRADTTAYNEMHKTVRAKVIQEIISQLTDEE